MKTKATYTILIELEIDLQIDINILESRIYTTSDVSKIDKALKDKKGQNFLCVSIEIELDHFESVSEGAAYARPRLLIILGILSFLTQELLTPFDNISSIVSVGSLEKAKNLVFMFNNFDFLPYVNKINDFIGSNKEGESRLFYSLIDRYRKALYLERESEDSMVHNDEIILSYFHILELLSSNYYIKQKKLAKQLVEQFTKSILENIYLIDGSQFESEFINKKKIIESLIISELPVGSKIMFMLKQHGILTPRLKAFISDLIKDRNSVAHGRQVYQERIIFPVPPFFPLIKNRNYSFETLRILTGRAISLYINIDHLKKEWREVELEFIPTFEELTLFLEEKKYENLTIEEFYSGKENNITPDTFTDYLLVGKLKVEKAIPALQNVIVNYREKQEEIVLLVLSVILIVDKTDNELRNKCIKIIKLASKNRWLPDFRMRDVLYYFEYFGHPVETLRDLINKKEIL